MPPTAQTYVRDRNGSNRNGGPAARPRFVPGKTSDDDPNTVQITLDSAKRFAVQKQYTVFIDGVSTEKNKFERAAAKVRSLLGLDDETYVGNFKGLHSTSGKILLVRPANWQDHMDNNLHPHCYIRDLGNGRDFTLN